MSFEVRALYDFNGEPHTSEMDIVAGEVLKVTRVDVGEGWWEGLNSAGRSGLFPQAYVEKISSSSAPPVAPVPEAPWSAPPQKQQSQQEDWDDDWDEDTYSEINTNYNTNHEQLYANEMNDNFAAHEGDIHHNIDNKGTVSKKSLNRFSSFVKNGGESYLMGDSKINPPENKIRIIKIDDNIYSWPVVTESYTVQVTSPKKESKLKGLKSYIAYQLTPSFNNIQVSRRYKHFDWLHERLSEKFSLLAVPPLPDKQISGRYEEQFIEHRRAQLQEFVDYVCRHPVISKCDVWQHFLTCTDEKLWKNGKRVAEKDQLVGANFCLSIEAPDKTLLPSTAEYLESHVFPFINTLDQHIKNQISITSDLSKHYRTIYSKENIKLGHGFFQLGIAIEGGDNKAIPGKLATIVKRIGSTYIDIGDLYDKQPTHDLDPIGDKLYLYKGITTSFQGVLAIHRGAQNKRKDCEKTMPGQTSNELKQRCDVITFAAMAEISHFKNERETDLKLALRRYLEEQIQFYQSIVGKLQVALNEFD